MFLKDSRKTSQKESNKCYKNVSYKTFWRQYVQTFYNNGFKMLVKCVWKILGENILKHFEKTFEECLHQMLYAKCCYTHFT